MISDVLKQAEEFVSGDPCGHLTLGWRNHLWDAILNDYGEGAAERWKVLCFLSAKQTLPKWRSLPNVPAIYRNLSENGLAICRQNIIEPDNKRAYREFVGYDWLVERFITDYFTPLQLQTGENWPTYAPMAVARAIGDSIYKRNIPESDYDADDIYGDYEKDAIDMACGDALGDSTGTEAVAEESRQYWRHWLREVFPRILADQNDVRGELIID